MRPTIAERFVGPEDRGLCELSERGGKSLAGGGCVAGRAEQASDGMELISDEFGACRAVSLV